MAGPLANIDTLIGGVNLDISRLLYYGDGVVMRFIVPDATQLDDWKTLLVLDSGFDRIPNDKGTPESKLVQFLISDTTGQVVKVIQSDDLHIEILDEIFMVSQVPNIGPNEGQQFTLNCKVRNIRKKGFDNSK